MNQHLLDDFYVIAVMTNPERFKTRPRLFKEFMQRMDKYGVKLYVVEGAFGEREFEVTDEYNPRHIRVITTSEIWHKENLINIGFSRLPSTWKYAAYIDADIDFVRPDWALETVHELQHNHMVQLFEDALDMGPNHEVMTMFKSFGFCYKNNLPQNKTGKVTRDPHDPTSVLKTVEIDKRPHDFYLGKPGVYWHPGYAWAVTRHAFETFGGLLDTAIAGAGDHHMACSMIGQANASIPKGLHPNYTAVIKSWEERALRLHKMVGYVKGTIYHFWHGKKKDRKYLERWDILIKNQFDPIKHLHRDSQGLLALYPGHIEIRDQLREYFQVRNEDSIDR